MIVVPIRRRTGRAGLAGLAVGLSLTLTACFGGGQSATTPVPVLPTVTPSAGGTTAAASPVAAAGQVSSSPEAVPTVAVFWPQQVEIPKIQVKAPVIQIGLDADGAMEAPNGPDVIGWYTGSVAPGVPGNSLVTAHVDWLDRSTGKSQQAVFWDLNKLSTGDQIMVRAEENKTFTYVVKESILVRFDDPDALKYLQPSEDTRLTVITCEGDFDQNTRNYDKRRIVIAELQ